MATNGFDRRTFLKAGALAAIAGSVKLPLAGADEVADSPYGPFKMGMQSYSVRNWKTLDEVLVKAKELGIKYVEFYPGHMDLDPNKAPEFKKKLDEAGINAAAIGVCNFGGDVKANRRIFEFAHAMGMYTVSADFEPKAAVSLDRLCEEFPDVHIGIHNHGPNSRYQKPEDVIACVKDHHKNLGATADLGHYIRSKQDPLEVLEKLKDRLYGCHFKDYKFNEKGQEQETIPGQGTLKVKEALVLLKKYNFQGCISLEYESNPANPIPDMQKALELIRAAVKEI